MNRKWFDSLFKDLFEYEDNRQLIGGTVESVAKITREDVVGFINKYYHPQNCYAIASGKVDHEKFVDYIDAINIYLYPASLLNVQTDVHIQHLNNYQQPRYPGHLRGTTL